MDFLERTMLIERGTSVGCYAILLFIVCYFINTSKSHKRICSVLNFYLLILTVMAFFFIPEKFHDLYRLWEISKGYSKSQFGSFFNNKVLSSQSPLSELLLYCGGKIGVLGVLPATFCLIFFGRVFGLLKKFSKKKQVNGEVIAMSLFLFMSTGSFLEVISDLRSFTAIAIVGTCIVDEICFQKKFLFNIPLYIVGGLLHLTAVPLIIFRLLFFIFFEHKVSEIKRIADIIDIIAVLGMIVVMAVFGRSYIVDALDKSSHYITSDSSYTYKWEYIIGFIQLITDIYVVSFLSETKPIGEQKKLRIMAICIILFELCFSFEYNTFHRYLVFLNILSLSYVCELGVSANAFKLCFGKKTDMLYLLVFATLLLVITRGNLCGFKFFKLSA